MGAFCEEGQHFAGLQFAGKWRKPDFEPGVGRMIRGYG